MAKDIRDETRERIRFMVAIDAASRAAADSARLEDMGLDELARRRLQDAGGAIKAAAVSSGKGGK